MTLERRFVAIGQFRQRHGSIDRQIANGNPPQGRQMSAAGKRLADVLGQCPDIGSLAAPHAQAATFAGKSEQVQRMDRHFARLAFDRHALSRQFIERAAVTLQCRMHWWSLANQAVEGLQYPFKVSLHETDMVALQHLAFRIAGRCSHAKQNVRLIRFWRIEQIGRKLGRLAEAKRQQARRQWIERSGMAALGGGVQTANRLQRGIGSHTRWLVEQHDAIDASPTARRT